MAGSLNRVTLVGNCGNDPEIKNLQNGGKVANLSVATSETWRDKNTGERKEKTEWTRVVIWNEALVGIVEKYVRKGSKLFIEGKLQTRKWQDPSGQDRYSTEIVLQGFDAKILLLGDGKGGNGGRDDSGGDAPAGRNTNHRAAAASSGKYDDDLDDDVPF